MNAPPRPRVLVTGSAGFLGWHLAGLLAARGWEVEGTVYRRRPPGAPFPVRFLDIRDRDAVVSATRDFRPRFVVHAAAVISPAACSDDPGLARAVNVEGTESVVSAARAAGAVVIFTSTDRVFDGARGRYREEDVPRPLGPYGKSKLAGEAAVLGAGPDNIVVRLPLMYGLPSPDHAPFTGWMLASFRGGEKMGLFLDQYRTPALVDDVVEAVARIIERPPAGGIYHLGGPERVSRAEFGYAMADVCGLDPGKIRPCLMSEKPGIPPTPRDVSLDSSRAAGFLGFRFRGIRDGLAVLAGSRG